MMDIRLRAGNLPLHAGLCMYMNIFQIPFMYDYHIDYILALNIKQIT